MNLKKALLAGGLIVALTFVIPATQVLGGEPAPDPDSEKIIGPKMWAVVVADCTNPSSPFFTMRVKKIEGCDVDTDPLSGAGTLWSVTGCPTSEAQVLNFRFPAGQVFDLPCAAIITKVKNYKSEPERVSFDARIEFVVPIGGPDVCQ